MIDGALHILYFFAVFMALFYSAALAVFGWDCLFNSEDKP